MALLIRRGSTRHAILVGPWVVKVPRLRLGRDGIRHFAYGWAANRREGSWRGRSHPALPRVHWRGAWDLIVVMERAHQPAEWLRDHLDAAVSLMASLPGCDSVRHDDGGPKVENFGFVGGRPVCLDFGDPRFPVDLEVSA